MSLGTTRQAGRELTAQQHGAKLADMISSRDSDVGQTRAGQIFIENLLIIVILI